MREEIQAEKDKHVANQERLHKELDALLDEQRNLAKEDDEEMPEKTEEQEAEESLDALLQNGANPVPSTMGQPEINKYLMDMQSKMEEQFTKRLEEERQKMVLELSKYIPGKGKGGGKEVDVVELSDTETSQEVMEVQRRQKALDGLGIVAGAIPGTPFGVQRLRRNNGSSPYGRKEDQRKKDEKEKDPKENMTVEQLLIQSAQMEKTDTGQ